MRTTTIELQGKEYLLCLSLQGIANLEKHYGGLKNVTKVMSKPNISDTIILLAEMMNCGAKYAKKNGIGNPEPLSQEELGDGLDIEDFALMLDKVGETVRLSTEHKIDIIPNQKATAPVSK